jgi:ABC-type multidrug transport system fused ATPase/permease subunit
LAKKGGTLQAHLASAERAFGLLDELPEVPERPNARRLGCASGSVVFDRVRFGYEPDRPVLHSVSFQVEPGTRVGIAGRTGAGKTTLMNLLIRLYDPSSGRILLDGVDLRRITLESLRRQISVVLQEPLLFSGTIADNIRYGRPEATFDEIVASARDANAHDFISRLPQGYDTLIGERGARLSGGERQRIAVARAFLKDAPVLILDEPTSSIDSKTEAIILDALDQLMVGRTTFMIAHRLSTVRHADFILVVHEGEIVERGTHQELMQLGGTYRQLHDIQTSQVQRREQRLAALAAARSVGQGGAA